MIAFAALALTATDASAAAVAAVAACAAQGQHVSAAVVGQDGEVRALIRGDDAPPHSVEAARRKAYTALSFEQPTEALVKLVTEHPDAAGLTHLDGLLFVGGGLPLVVGGKVVGGVGVAGAKGPGIDGRCAVAAIDRLGGDRK